MPSTTGTTPSLPSSSSSSSSSSSARVRFRFSGLSSTSTAPTLPLSKQATVTNPIDAALTALISDVGSIVLGLTGLVLLLIGRAILNTADDGGSSSDVVSVEDMAQETRTNLLAVVACGSVLLNGLSKLDVDSVLAETVQLHGKSLAEPMLAAVNEACSDSHTETIKWVLNSLILATPAKTAIVLQSSSFPTLETDMGLIYDWRPVAIAGIVPWNINSIESIPLPGRLKQQQRPSAILDRFAKAAQRGLGHLQKETYLPTLQSLPGKVEFTYLPDNTQAVLLLPVNCENHDNREGTSTVTTTVIVLGSNQARSFTPRDIAWCQSVANRLNM